MAQAPPGTMAAVLGLAAEKIAAALADLAGLVVVANDNAPGQIIISGEVEAVERGAAAVRAAGATRVVPLSVGGAFHSPLMSGPAALFAPYLDRVSIERPRIPIVGNVSGELVETVIELRHELTEQMTRPVLWRQTMLTLAAAGATAALECGPGAVLAGLARRSTAAVAVHPLATWADVLAVAETHG